MRATLASICLLVVASQAFSQTNSIVGKWGIYSLKDRTNIDAKDEGKLEFKKDLSFAMDGLPAGRYVVTQAKRPIWVNISLVRPSDKKLAIVAYGLAEFIDPKTAKFQMFKAEPGKQRPTKFYKR